MENPHIDAPYIDSEYGRLRDVLVCRPEYFDWVPYGAVITATLASGGSFDRDLARRQHDELVAAYESAGVRVYYSVPDPALVYQVYTRDSSFMTPWGAVITQLSNWRRRGEYAPALRFYQANGIPIFGMVTAGTFEGGDFHIVRPGLALIGYDGTLHTQRVAAEQVRGWIEAKGWEVRLQPIPEHAVHIDAFVCMLAPGLAAVCHDLADDDLLAWLKAKGVDTVPVSYKDMMALGCNALSLGARVISSAGSRDLNATLRAMGITVYDPDISMFTRDGGGVHCLAMPLRRDPE